MSSFNRRQFLQATGLFAAGAALSKNVLAASPKKLKDFGLQLYTLRDVLPKDPKGILKQVAEFGYTQAEGYEGPQGMFWGMTPSDFKKYMDDLNLKFVSSHCDISKDFEKKAADAASIGMKYLICPYKGPQKGIDDFKRFADEFNAKGEICKKNGIRFAYHNHGYSFQTLDGQIPQDVMMDNTNPDTVDFEMDMYWVITGGADINAYLKKYGKRWRLCHVKDRKKGADPKDADASCILGQGQIDYPTILTAAKKSGVEYFIVEQERYDNSTSLESAKADAAYMKNLSI
ncbi:sugar phosphate isomerase/epimerase [Danxiaibacter flavus]|uniref:Sugar phosphate isomerase/epimerase n=1 Tax=Danxiaibacter flavus TaxID=3049108 RepID=A0ABV3ZLL3_9BACT|nr:sugar phosphate isomerase/epimerase [Chitinophagaceae bacterium DXS]